MRHHHQSNPISVTRNLNGSWVVTGEVECCFRTLVLYGYTKREAVREWRKHFQGERA